VSWDGLQLTAKAIATDLRVTGMKEEFGRYLNVVDVEATCWETLPPAGQQSEIIEIGVCVVDLHALDRVRRARLMVRPAVSQVSDFCTQLTGITQAEADHGTAFEQACSTLEREFHSKFRPWASWGDYDRKQFQRQCSSSGTSYPFSSRHTNAKAVFSKSWSLRTRLGMGQALRHAGLPLEGRHHRGEDDAWNIGALVIDLVRRDHGALSGGGRTSA
jgi:inhibitor of KinA sporulation pathway (predicted exonuclease)